MAAIFNELCVMEETTPVPLSVEGTSAEGTSVEGTRRGYLHHWKKRLECRHPQFNEPYTAVHCGPRNVLRTSSHARVGIHLGSAPYTSRYMLAATGAASGLDTSNFGAAYVVGR